MDSATLFGYVTMYYTSSHISSLCLVLSNTLNIAEGFVQIYQLHISVTIPVLLSHSFFNIHHPPLILFLPPAAALLYKCCSGSLLTITNPHSHPLCCSLASGYIFSRISLSLSVSQPHRQSRLRSLSFLDLCHWNCLTASVIFQIWPLIGFLLRLSQ